MIARAKIVATVGPASSDQLVLRALLEQGVAVFRLNLAHGRHADLSQTIENIRAAARELGQEVGIMADLAGPKIRTGPLVAESVLLEAGQKVVLTTAQAPGTAERLSVSYPDFPVDVEPGQAILISDGLLKLVVEQKRETEVFCRVEIGGQLRANQGINLPETTIKTPTLTDKDLHDLQFCLESQVDIIAMSFVRTPSDIQQLKDLISQAGRDCPVIAKIENHEAIPHIDNIIEAADGVMIARGDLGVEVPTEDVPILQKQIIETAQRRGRVSIVATQMLDSMIRSPRPTRAEAGDVANAVFDGADAVMLSGETAIGQYALEAVVMMDRIIKRAESAIDYRGLLVARSGWAAETISGAISYATCHLASTLPAAAIATSTESGRTAKQVSRFRPQAPIMAVTPNSETARQLMLWWGVTPRVVVPSQDIDGVFKTALTAIREWGLAKSGQPVVLTAGALINVPDTTNIIKVERI